MNATMRALTLFSLFAAIWLALAVATANAQIIVNPDFVSDTVTVSLDGNALARLEIKESQEDGQILSLLVPGTIIELTEPTMDGTTTLLSDRLIIDPYEILFASDSLNPLPPRAGAVPVPENFQPLAMKFASDYEDPAGNFSDFVEWSVAGGPPTRLELLELPTPGAPEIIDQVIPGASYDMLENAADLSVSDYLDITDIHFTFESDSTEQGLEPLLATDFPGYLRLPPLPEVDANNVSLAHFYEVSASSDGEIPEPASVVLLGIAAIGIVGSIRRRK